MAHMDKASLRAKLLRMIPRNLLEELAQDAGVERPWYYERKYLETRVATAWSSEVFETILVFIERAR
jgi:hypothetical protein